MKKTTEYTRPENILIVRICKFCAKWSHIFRNIFYISLIYLQEFFYEDIWTSTDDCLFLAMYMTELHEVFVSPICIHIAI